MSASAQDTRPARRRPGRPRGQDSAVVRDGALRAAIDLIAEQGYAATSMAQVAEAAGISPSGLAHHFPSKAALLGAVLDHRDAMDALPPPEGEEGPWDAFDQLVVLAGTNMERRQLVALYTTMIGEAIAPAHPAHGWMRRHFDLVLELLRETIRTGQERGLVRQDAPVDRLARETIALMDGLQVQWLLDPTVDMAEVMAQHVEELKRTWGTAPS